MRRVSLIVSILFIAAFFRLQNVNWDQGTHLHPDERFLTLVGVAMRTPKSLGEYLSPTESMFNPARVGYAFFVYGTLPLVATKLAAGTLGMDSYAELVLVGRVLSAMADLGVVLLIYKTIELWEKKYQWHSDIKYYGAFLYSLTVMPIQLSHFFAVDTFLNFFMFASFYSALRFWAKGRGVGLVVSALCFGAAVGCKITAIFILPLGLFFILLREGKWAARIGRAALYLGIAYIAVRMSDPYLFQGGNFLDPTPSALFLKNLHELKSFSGRDVWFPPAVQWMSKTPILFSLQNLMLWGVGLTQTALVAIGAAIFLRGGTRRLGWAHRIPFIAISLWMSAYFFYQSTQFAQTMRYFLPLYPFLTIIAAFGLDLVVHILTSFHPVLEKRKIRPASLILTSLFLLLLLAWPFAFSSLYFQPHSRVAASRWIYQNIPPGKTILVEHWDDALPVSREEGGSPTQYDLQELPVYGPDTDEKWKTMNSILGRGDYYILSSNRAWASIEAVPWKYPLQSEFYKALFAGRTSYQLVAEFHSYPHIALGGWKWEIPDQAADESFTVYDHPQVFVFKNVSSIAR